MKQMISSVSFQGIRVSGFLYSYHMGSLQISTHTLFLTYFHSRLLEQMVYGSHLLQLYQDPLKIFLYLSALINYPSSWKYSHFILGLQLVSLLQSQNLLWGLYNNIPSLIHIHLHDSLLTIHNFKLAYSPWIDLVNFQLQTSSFLTC